MPSIEQIAVLGLALGFGIAFAFSFSTQMRLQAGAMAGDRQASLFNRVTMAGLSMAILFGAIVVAKELNPFVDDKTFILTAASGAAISWLVRWRSNRSR